MTKHKNILPALLLVALTSCAGIYNHLNGCPASYSPPNWGELQNQLLNAQTQWNTTKLVAYQFTLDPMCFCPQRSLEVTVQNDAISVVDKISGTALSHDEAASYKIAALHAQISQHIGTHGKCDSLAAQYDQNGVPTGFNWSDQYMGIQDAFYGYKITNFKILN